MINTKEHFDKQADLLLAYQYGQDYAASKDEAVKTEALTKFAGDTEALAEFNRGANTTINHSA